MTKRDQLERLTTANSTGVLHGTRRNAPISPIASGITKLANLVHTQVLSDERHVANLESLKDEFGIGTTVATTPEPLKAFLNVLYVREADVIPRELGVVLPRDFGKWPEPSLNTKSPELDQTPMCDTREGKCLSEREGGPLGVSPSLFGSPPKGKLRPLQTA